MRCISSSNENHSRSIPFRRYGCSQEFIDESISLEDQDQDRCMLNLSETLIKLLKSVFKASLLHIGWQPALVAYIGYCEHSECVILTFSKCIF